jgi:membrane-bound lytic murein transglycosylase F
LNPVELTNHMRAKRLKIIFATTALGIALSVPVLMRATTDQPTVLDQVKKKGELVVVTRLDPSTYYEGPLGPTGFEYDLAGLFAAHLGVKLKIIVAENFNDILPIVASRQAHVAAAGLTITPARKQRVHFGPAYDQITQQLIYRAGTIPPGAIEDTSGGTIEVVSGSSHAEHLAHIAQIHHEIQWREHHDTSVQELLAAVWERRVDYTIADSNDVRLYQRIYPELRVAFDVAEPELLGWAFPKGGDDSLYHEAEKFFDVISSNGQLSQLKERYYGYVKDFDYVGTRLFFAHTKERLEQYAEKFKTAAAKYGHDWRLLAAVGYQESHWNPQAISPTGVRGIMMLTRKTAADMGIRNRIDANNSIEGGARYLQNLKKRIPRHIPDPDRTWFALAAYNIGLGHLNDARRITELRGGNPDNWIEVKRNLPLLMDPAWLKETLYGYARGTEAVRYVERIRSYYDMLVWTEESEQAYPAQLTAARVSYQIGMNDRMPSPVL